jgi:hypothetical protein
MLLQSGGGVKVVVNGPSRKSAGVVIAKADRVWTNKFYDKVRNTSSI